MTERIISLIHRFVVFTSAFVLALSMGAQAEDANSGSALPDAPQAQTEPQDAATVRNTPENILKDQAGIWTSPFRMRAHDLKWVVPLGLATGAAIATDHRTLRDVVSL